MAEEAEDRTEAPTPKRLERARQEGQVAVSRESVQLASLAAAALAMVITLPVLLPSAMGAFRTALEGAALEGTGQAGLATPIASLLRSAALILLPIALAPLAAAAGITMLQTGGVLSTKGLVPDVKRLSPLAGLKRIFGVQGAVELLRNLLKLLVLSLALWHAARQLPPLREAMEWSAGSLLIACGRSAMSVLIGILPAFTALALLDFAWVRLRHWRGLRMSREDLRQENRESEGDPQFKARRRAIARARARRRMLAQVPKASVVITNPTHYAVALRYATGQSAPRVVAKGVDAMAARIRAVAEEHRIPLVANPPLARALYLVEPDTEIPPEHYKAVAEVIAFIWRMQKRR